MSKKSFLFEYQDSCLVDQSVFAELKLQLVPEIEYVHDQVGSGYACEYGFVNLPSDMHMHQSVKQMVAEKKKLYPKLMVICGIGGSSLGTTAVLQAVHGVFYNNERELQIYFADTVDTNMVGTILSKVEAVLKEGGTVLVNVISKSGTTTETIANFELFFALLKHYHKENAAKYVVVTTDDDSPLSQRARAIDISVLPIPQTVGGRYSVFSSVGQFPLAIVGVDVESLLCGARDAVVSNTAHDEPGKENMAALNAAIKYKHYRESIRINNLFLFASQLEGIGKWYRQLLAESLGKVHDVEGAVVNVGITPTVSVGSTDLHSVGQLYLAGPYDKFTTFVSVESVEHSLSVPRQQEFTGLVARLEGKSLALILNAILQGTKRAYKDDKRPFCSIVLPKLTPYCIGQLLQMCMIEVVYLGFLLKVNPFDQPQVELYKKKTRKLL